MSVVETTSRGVRPNIYLRTPHLRYLRAVAEQESITLSGAFAAIINQHGDTMLHSPRRVEKVVPHVFLTQEQLGILDRLAAHMGITRSDMARRLIDEAMGSRILEAC